MLNDKNQVHLITSNFLIEFCILDLLNNKRKLSRIYYLLPIGVCLLKMTRIYYRNSQALTKELNSIIHKLQSSKYIIKVKAKLYN